MILPGKHLRRERSLLGLGGEILEQLNEEATVSELWERVASSRKIIHMSYPLSYDWFILALTVLYAISAVDFNGGVITPRGRR